MSILNFQMFRLINDENFSAEIDESVLFAEINRNINSSILSIVDMENNVLLSAGLI